MIWLVNDSNASIMSCHDPRRILHRTSRASYRPDSHFLSLPGEGPQASSEQKMPPRQTSTSLTYHLFFPSTVNL